MEKINNGKVRDIYDVGDNRLVIVTSDRISAFDEVLPNLVTNKGKLLNLMSAFWFEHTKEICPNHMISIENSSVCGIGLPKGIKQSEKLPEPLYTPTTKAGIDEHDEHICFEETVQLVGTDIAEQLREKSIALYKAGAAYAEKKGILIADTKFEFGIDEENNVVLADEVLTPDSSRFWDAKAYEVGKSQQSFDKQFLRDYLIKNGGNTKFIPNSVLAVTSDKYKKAYEMLCK